MLTVWTDVLLETLIIFLLIFLKAHLLFEYPGIWLPSLFLELCLCVKQAVGLTCKLAQGGDWTRPRLIYQWIICSASKPLKCVVVAADFPKGITLSFNCLHDRESGGDGNADVEVRIRRYNGRWGRKDVGDANRKRGNWNIKRRHRASRPSISRLWNAKPPIFWLLLWKQLRFPFSKIFFPYLSDPSGEIHLLALTLASSSKSGTRPV